MLPLALDLDFEGGFGVYSEKVNNIETAHSGLQPTLPKAPDMDSEGSIGNILY